MFDFDRGTKVLLGVTASVGLGYSISWLMRQQQLKRFEKIGTVKELVVYPVKSCKGVYVNQAECTQFGLRVNGVGDRTWMLIRENNRFLSQRQEPKMALISVKLTDDGIVLEAPGMELLKLPKVPRKDAVLRHCWGVVNNPVEGLDCGDEAANWVSQFLGTPGYRIVQYSKDLTRRNFAYEQFGQELFGQESSIKDGDMSVYSDLASYLLLPESSLEALNKELPSPVTMRSFRPNIIVTGTQAYDEDNWIDIRLGDSNQMRCIAACPRCTLTTVNPESGEKSQDGEPLKTLKRVRMFDYYKGGPMMGMFLAPDMCGSIKVGDPLYALRKKPST